MHKSFKLILLSILTFSITAFLWGIVNIFFLEKLPTNYINIQKQNNFYNIHLEKLFATKHIKQKIIVKKEG
jgi:hypothetical protein